MFRKPKSLPAEIHRHPYSDRRLIAISGMGRSGTTVLRHCLSQHSRIDCANRENNYLHDLMRAATSNLEIPSRTENLAVSEAVYWQLHQQMVLHLVWPVDRLHRPDDSSYPDAIATYTMLDPRAAIGLEKLFDDVVIFYICRNGIEVVSSYVSFEPFKSQMSFADACKLWALREDMIQYSRDRDHVFLFRHEWLRDEELFQRKLTEALGMVDLEFETACLKPLAKTYHPTRYDGESSVAARDLGQRDQRWQLWSDEQRSTFETLCRGRMESQGYPIPWI